VVLGLEILKTRCNKPKVETAGMILIFFSDLGSIETRNLNKK
jgi:hypothetical protein